MEVFEDLVGNLDGVDGENDHDYKSLEKEDDETTRKKTRIIRVLSSENYCK